MTVIHKLDNRYFIQTGGVELGSNDSNNCSCRALANANNWTLEQGTSFMQVFGRKKNKGSFLEQFLPAYQTAGFKKILVFGAGKSANYFAMKADARRVKGTTFGNLLKTKDYSKGTHIIIVTGHAVCIKDGQPVDTDGTVINKNKRVLMAFSKV